MSCRKEIPAYVEVDCGFEKGRINACAFVTEELATLAIDNPTLLTDPSFWMDESYTGDILIHKKVSGSFSSAENPIPGKGNQQSRLGGFNHTSDLRIEDIKGNNLYWDALNISDNYYQALITDNYNLLIFSTVAVGIMGKIVIEDNLESVAEWQVITSWSDIANPITSDVPLGVFN